ncbi:MAG TPA: lycopene cyclase family protein, partial [Roseiflexaceae bacterium]|nr:lycopene cyclase family protein [Roseiflexaceae bacterium]
ALWPRQRVRRRGLYLLGLASLLRMDAAQLQVFFHAFFRLPRQEWAGYLSDRLSTPQLLGVMLRLFGHLPGHLRATLLDTAWRERSLLVAAI